VYLTALHREPDASTTALVDALNAGTLTRGQAATFVVNSQEGKTAQVGDAFRMILDREADLNGQAAFVNFLNNGGTYEQMEALLASSQEYLVLKASDPTPSVNAQYVDALYSTFLGRSGLADPASSTFVNLLNSGVSRFDVASLIINSTEGRTASVQIEYDTVLNRAADASGLAGWVSALANGSTAPAIEIAFLASPEFFVRGATG